jgi:hypothetical protein
MAPVASRSSPERFELLAGVLSGCTVKYLNIFRRVPAQRFMGNRGQQYRRKMLNWNVLLSEQGVAYGDGRETK